MTSQLMIMAVRRRLLKEEFPIGFQACKEDDDDYGDGGDDDLDGGGDDDL